MTLFSEAQPWQRLAEYTLPSAVASVGLAIEKVTDSLQPLHLTEPLLNRLHKAIAEVIGNAVAYDLRHQVQASILLRINLAAHAAPDPLDPPAPPAWGFFLIERRVELIGEAEQVSQHGIELYLYQERNEPRPN